MGFLLLIGHVLISIGLPLGILLSHFSQPQYIITCFTASMFWLIPHMLCTILLAFVLNVYHYLMLYQIFTSIMLESSRLIYLHLFLKWRRTFLSISTNRIVLFIGEIQAALISGAGWGLISSFSSHFSEIVLSFKSGTLYRRCELFSDITFLSIVLFLNGMNHIISMGIVMILFLKKLKASDFKYYSIYILLKLFYICTSFYPIPKCIYFLIVLMGLNLLSLLYFILLVIFHFRMRMQNKRLSMIQ